MAARKVTYAPREAVGEPRDPQRWCRLGKHIDIPYQFGTKICTICQRVSENAWNAKHGTTGTTGTRA